jgi:opacity protein-like surface antigen
MRATLSALALGLSLAAPAAAQDVILGLGASDFEETAGTLTAEYHFAPFHDFGWIALGFGGAVMIDTEADFWIGAGLTFLSPLGERWFVEASLMPGYYENGSDDTDLGSEFEFRSLIGVGYRITDRAALSLAVDHRSNASTASSNPGVNTLSLRLRARF